jgi:hypothetical protein
VDAAVSDADVAVIAVVAAVAVADVDVAVGTKKRNGKFIITITY